MLDSIRHDLVDSALVGVSIPTVFLLRQIAQKNKEVHNSFLKIDKEIIHKVISRDKKLLVIAAVVSAGAFFVGKQISAHIERDSKTQSFQEKELARRKSDNYSNINL